MQSSRLKRWGEPAAVALACFILFSANGREIGSSDSQPTRFTVQALLLQGTLRLDDVTAAIRPVVLQHPGFALDEQQHLRSAYSVVPAVLAAGLAWPWVRTGLIDLSAPMTPSLIAKSSASLIVAVAVALGFVVARRRVSSRAAAVLAAGLGLGTNYWALASQTLWQHETVALGLLGALVLIAVPVERLTTARLLGASALMGLAAAARPQVTIAVVVLTIWSVTRRRRWLDSLTAAPLAAMGLLTLGSNVLWFGHPLGAIPRLEALHPIIHHVNGSFGTQPWMAAAGLLLSPSRGLLLFSPVVLVALAGFQAARREGWTTELRWCAIATALQFAAYACYSVWWGGHTYGPRYTLDLLPLLLPLAAAGLPLVQSRPWLRTAAALALAWSIAISATGAFVYPAEQWNIDPANVDVDHSRLWDWSDPQFVRCWRTHQDPRNFRLWFDDSAHLQRNVPLR